MAHIEQDSELFTNYVSAQAIPAGQQFTAFADESGAPAIVSLSSDGVLYLFKQNNGRLENQDFGKLLGISDTVSAYAAVQCSDAGICMAFATRTANGSQVSILPMLSVKSLSRPNTSKIIKTTDALPDIHALEMSDFLDDAGYPTVVAFYHPADRIKSQSDCALIEYSKEGDITKASLSSRWSLPVDLSGLLDVAFAKTSLGRGIFVLYQDSSATQKLLFSTYDGSDFNVLTKCPPALAISANCGISFGGAVAYLLADVRCLTTFTPGKDANGAVSHLILGGGSIYHLTQKEYLHRDRDGIKATGKLLEGAIKSIQSAVFGDHFSLWFTTEHDAAGYLTTTISSPDTALHVVPLLPRGKGGRLSGMLTMTSIKSGKAAVNTLVSVDEKEHLTTLQQDSAKGIWDAYPLMSHTATKNYRVDSYTTRIRIMSGVNRAAAYAKFKLKCSGRISAIVNGFDTPLEEEGQVLSCDSAGEATFVTATADISAHTMSISEIKDRKGNPIVVKKEDGLIQPSRKAMVKLKGIRDAATLKSAKTRDGKALVDVSGLSDKDVQQIGQNIGALADHAEKLHKSPNTVPLTLAEHASTLGLTSAEIAAGELWQWALDKVHDAETWIVDLSGSVATFVVTIAGAVQTFVLDSLKTIGKALTWLWTKVKAGFKALIDYLGFLFEWKDIVNAKNSMSAMLSAGLLWSSDEVGHTKDIAAKWFADLKGNLISVKATDQGKIDAAQHSTAPDEKGKESQSSIGSNFTTYHLKHGGALAKFLPELAPEDLALIQNTWASIQAIISQAVADVKKMVDDIGKAFEDIDDSVSLLDAVKIVLADAAVIFLDVAAGIVALVLGVIRDVIKWIVANGNKTVQIPIFSSLYRDISGGHELTMFDAISLIIAIPATVIYKIIKGKALPDISSFMNKDTYTGYIDGSLDDAKFKQVNDFAGGAFIASDLICTLMQLLDDATLGTVSTMAIRVESIDGHALVHPQVRAMNFTPPDYTGSKALSWVNLVASGVNVVSGCPAWKAYSDGTQRGLDWTRWSIALGRWGTSAAGRAGDFSADLKFSSNAKKTIDILSAVAQVITVLMYVDKRVKVDDGKSYILRDLIVTSSLINTLSKAGVAISKGNDVDAQAAFEVIYLATSISNGVLQVSNVSISALGYTQFGQSST